MTDPTPQIDELVAIFGRLGIDVREESLGGSGGGLCSLRGQRVMFIDRDVDLATRLDQCIGALADLPDLDRIYVRPAIRERIDRYLDEDR